MKNNIYDYKLITKCIAKYFLFLIIPVFAILSMQSLFGKVSYADLNKKLNQIYGYNFKNSEDIVIYPERNFNDTRQVLETIQKNPDIAKKMLKSLDLSSGILEHDIKRAVLSYVKDYEKTQHKNSTIAYADLGRSLNFYIESIKDGNCFFEDGEKAKLESVYFNLLDFLRSVPVNTKERAMLYLVSADIAAKLRIDSRSSSALALFIIAYKEASNYPELQHNILSALKNEIYFQYSGSSGVNVPHEWKILLSDLQVLKQHDLHLAMN